jgi:hypothetical protein
MSFSMPSQYLSLARERAQSRAGPYRQPEEFGYDFREWVSPYTKGAHRLGGLALVLQDWSSTDALSAGFDPSIQEHGRNVRLLTNTRLEAILARVFDLQLTDVYATNVFPFVKPGGISASIPREDVLAAPAGSCERNSRSFGPRGFLRWGPLPPPRSGSLALSIALFHTRPRESVPRSGTFESGSDGWLRYRLARRPTPNGSCCRRALDSR